MKTLAMCAAVGAMSWHAAFAADWVEAESDNFVFHGDVGPEKARETVRELEIFRSTVLTLMGADSRAPEVRKVRIFGERDARGVQKLTGMGGIAGVYTLGDDYPVFVTIAGSKRRRDDQARMTTLHEFSHHVVSQHTAQFYPRWYNEGLAEYFASFQIEGDIVTVGEPASVHGLILKRRGWTDAEIVFSAVAEYPFEGGTYRERLRAGYFYGMSWLGVHYLMSTPELGRRVDDYVALINRGVEPQRAFEEGFGLTQKEFGKRIYAYWTANEFPMVHFRLGEAIAEPEVMVREITKDEARTARFEAEAIFRKDPKDRARTRSGIEEALARGGPDARLYASSMTLVLKARDHDGAVAAGRQAVAALPDDPLAMQTLADALFHRALDARVARRRPDDLGEAIALFKRQLTLEPNSPTANLHLPTAVNAMGAKPDQAVMDAVAFNLNYRRSPSNFGVYLDGAAVMARLGADGEKCALLAVVEPWIRAADAALDEEARAARGRNTPSTRLEGLSAGACAAP